MGLKPVLVLLVMLAMFSSMAYGDNCAGAFMEALNSNVTSGAVVAFSGKFINDLGDMDGCEATPGMKYGTLKLATAAGNFFLGMCLPDNCTNSDMGVLSDAMVSIGGGAVTSSTFSFTKEETVEVNGWRIFGFISFFALAAICLMGSVVEYTSLFDKPKRREDEEPAKDVAMQKTVIGKAFISFSPTRNLYELFYSKFDDTDNLRILNGVRVLSMLYVVFGHAYFSVINMVVANPTYIPEVVQPLWFQIIPGGFYAVDVFFYLSSFLGAYLMVLKFEKNKRVPFGMVYFHRFYRLAPTVFLFLMFILTFYRSLGSGPVWNASVDQWIGECPDYWWSFVLFINSVVIPGRQPVCVGWLWYLSHDMFFFMTLPIQVFLYLKKRTMGYAAALFLLVANLAIVLGVSAGYGIGASIFTNADYASKIYFVPWTRFGAYQVGVLIGFMYYEYVKGNKSEGDKRNIGYKFYKSIEISTPIRWICYVTGIVICLICVYIMTPETRRILRSPYFSLGFAYIWNPINRPLFVFALSLILAGPLTGKGSFLQTFLGSRFWAPWAKISFYCYMIHLLVFTFFYGQERQAFYINNKAIFWVFFGVMVITFILATAMSMFIEAPLLQLERLVLFPPRAKKPRQEEASESSFEPKGINNSVNSSNTSDTDLKTEAVSKD